MPDCDLLAVDVHICYDSALGSCVCACAGSGLYMRPKNQ